MMTREPNRSASLRGRIDLGFERWGHRMVRFRWLASAAMLFTSVVLSAGFLIFVLAYTSNIAVFELLSGLAVGIAFLADVTLAPALMILVTRSSASSVQSQPHAAVHR